MKIKKLIGALVLSLALLIDVGPVAVRAQENDLVSEDDAYDSSFSGPLIYCRRADTALALADDAQTMPILCDNEGKLYTTAAGGSGGAVTNAGTFVVQEDGAALTALEKIDDFISGSEGQVDVITSALPSGASISAKQLADGHGVSSTLVAGLLNANSPVTLIDTFSLFDGSGETQISTTNLGASKAYSVPGTGRLVQICVIVSLGTPFAENMSIIFFDADPSVTIEDTSLTLAASQNITNIISLRGSDFRDNFTTTKTNCQTIDEQYVVITHVVFASEGVTTYDDEDVEIRVLYRRHS